MAKPTEDEVQVSAVEAALLDEFRCPVCMDDIPAEDLFLPHAPDIKCMLCRECARRAIKSSIEQRQLPVQCPICMANAPIDARRGQSAPDALLTHAAICSVLDEEEQQDFHRRERDQWCDENPNAHPCLTADCPGLAIFDDGDPRCHCPLCNLEWCGLCNKDHQATTSCAEFAEWQKDNGQADEKFEALMQKDRMKTCPNCKNAVFKKEGCNKMKCRCKHVFCYVCGESLDAADPYRHFNKRGAVCPLFDGQEEAQGLQRPDGWQRQMEGAAHARVVGLDNFEEWAAWRRELGEQRPHLRHGVPVIPLPDRGGW